MRNERGSALLTTMLIVLIFTILGISLLSFSISGAKKTEVRETDVEINTKDLTNLKEGVSRIESNVAFHNDTFGATNMDNYNSLIKEVLTGEFPSSNGRKYSISDISNQYNIGNSFTRVLQIESGKYKQKVFLSAMPSFFKYALGSRGALTINGSVAIDGDIYARNALYISNAANYVYNNINNTQDATFPSFASISNNQEVKESVGKVSILDTTNTSYCEQFQKCYGPTFDRTVNNWNPITDFKNAIKGTPTIVKDEIQYVEVELQQTFIDKLALNGFSEGAFNDKYHIAQDLTNLYKLNGQLNVLDKIENLSKDGHQTSFYYESSKDEETVLIEGDTIDLDKEDWLIINGNVRFESSALTPMTIKANMLVTGDVTFVGDFNLESVMYSLGKKATFNNVNINNENATFILMTDGDLQFARVNKFKNDMRANIINGFLYTTQDAEVYGVGSLIYINGGIFSKGSLTVNAYQGEALQEADNIKFTPSNLLNASRLKVKNDKRLFLHQLEALPKVDNIEVIPDRIEKIK